MTPSSPVPGCYRRRRKKSVQCSVCLCSEHPAVCHLFLEIILVFLVCLVKCLQQTVCLGNYLDWRIKVYSVKYTIRHLLILAGFAISFDHFATRKIKVVNMTVNNSPS